MIEPAGSIVNRISVEKTKDGGYGEIRLVAGNKKYTDIIDVRVQSGYTGDRTVFVPNSLYTDYFPQSLSFEEVCSKAAIQRQDVHTYAHISNVDVWFDIYAMPLDYQDGDQYYCAYTA